MILLGGAGYAGYWWYSTAWTQFDLLFYVMIFGVLCLGMLLGEALEVIENILKLHSRFG